MDYDDFVAEWFGSTTTGVDMKSLIALSVISFASLALAADQVPTPADGTTSILSTTATTANATAAAAVVATAPAASCGDCCETAKEVKLGPWQARRLARQAERQEVRDCRDCCKDACGCKKQDCRPTAVVVTRARRTCCCN